MRTRLLLMPYIIKNRLITAKFRYLKHYNLWLRQQILKLTSIDVRLGWLSRLLLVLIALIELSICSINCTICQQNRMQSDENYMNNYHD